jgi:tetratricopeptide (TPR) repeat protein
MSLLLDALKKAEKAKDDARRREQLDGSDADNSEVQVRTRGELPDISRPLEIHSEDLSRNASSSRDNPVPDAFSTAPLKRSATTQSPDSEHHAETSTKLRQARADGDTAFDPQSAQRTAAKQVFEAKFREPNPRLPFFITMALLGVFAVGTVVYFWYQLRPPPALVNTNAKPPPDEKKLEAPSQPASQLTPVPQRASSSTQDIPAIPGLPHATQASVSAPVPLTTAKATVPAATSPGVAVKPSVPAEASPVRARVAANTSKPQTLPQAARASDPSEFSVNRAVPRVNPRIEVAWQAYNRGDLKVALANYRDVLTEEPTNRDALLGMAALEVRANRLEEAEIYYRRLLQVNPRDPYAQTGLLALRGQLADPVQTESRVKTLLSTDPEAQVLNFTLGNQYAQQGRWSEAQQAYFKAYAAEPENPDFAYNLAVSLDQVRQPKVALEYYRRAIALALQRSSSFDQTLARNRVQELAK